MIKAETNESNFENNVVTTEGNVVTNINKTNKGFIERNFYLNGKFTFNRKTITILSLLIFLVFLIIGVLLVNFGMEKKDFLSQILGSFFVLFLLLFKDNNSRNRINPFHNNFNKLYLILFFTSIITITNLIICIIFGIIWAIKGTPKDISENTSINNSVQIN